MYVAQNIVVIFAGFLILSACVDDVPNSRRTAFDNQGGLATGGQITQSSLGQSFSGLGGGATGTRRTVGTDEFLDPALLQDSPTGRAQVIDVGEGQVEMNLFDATIEAAAQAVLGDALERPFVVADGLEGRITLQTTGPIEKAALLELFEQALEANGAEIQSSGVSLRIVPRSTGRRIQSASNAIQGDGAIVVAPLRFISATQMSQLLAPIVGSGLQIATDQKRNILLLSGDRADLRAAVEALNVFDVDVLKGKSTALVRLTAAEPESVSAELEAIFDTGPGGALEGVIDFLPNPRLKSLLVISTRSTYLGEAEAWIRELDKTAGASRRYTRTYLLQNRSPEFVAPILEQALGGSASDTAPTEGEDGEVRPAPSAGLQIIPDAERNTVIVRALRAEHEEVERLVAELDTHPTQVMLEATIAEVTLTDDLSLGVRWFFESGNFSTSFSDLATGAVASVFPGFSTVFASGNDRVALSALASVTNVKVVSSPTLMVLNNQEAELRIGDQVPIATREAQSVTDPDAPVVTTVEYRDTGIILTVRPRIGRNGQVVLDINQEVSDVIETTTSGIDSPTIRQRNIRTNVVVANGETLALGGLIQERDTKTNTKVPLLGDIPAVGAVFRSKRDDIERTELLILIRPRVIASREDAKAATEYWRQKLSAPNEVLQNGLQPGQHRVGDLFR